jgi:outer membrane receptor for ferric coprogen and ferric-rhodotorulic acid
MGPADVWKLSDTYLKPLKSDQYAVGYFRNFMDNTLEFSAEAYYKNVHNAIEYKSGAEIAMNPYLETDIINAMGYNVGLELYLKKNAGQAHRLDQLHVLKLHAALRGGL